MFASAFKAAKGSIIGLILLEIVWYGLEQIDSLAFLAGDWLYLVKFFFFGWAGYTAAKMKLSASGAALAGALGGLAVEIADVILSKIFYPEEFLSVGGWVIDFIEWIVIAAVVAAIVHAVVKKKAA